MNDNDGKVEILHNLTSLDIPASRVLSSALGMDLETAIVIGYTRTGAEYFAGSTADLHKILWLLERFKKQILEEE